MPVKTVADVIEYMENFAPPGLCAVWDNSGLLLGRRSVPVKKILLALDATESAVAEAVSLNADMLITHHPLIYKPVSAVTDADHAGRKLLTLAENGIALYAAHTNLDACKGGINDILGELLGFIGLEPTMFEENVCGGLSPFGRIGFLDSEMTLGELAAYVKEKLDDESAAYSGDKVSVIKKIGFACGSGAKFIPEAAGKGCDVFITGDIRYHDCVDALESGINLISFGHYQSERIILGSLEKKLSELDDVNVTVFKDKALPFNKI